MSAKPNSSEPTRPVPPVLRFFQSWMAHWVATLTRSSGTVPQPKSPVMTTLPQALGKDAQLPVVTS